MIGQNFWEILERIIGKISSIIEAGLLGKMYLHISMTTSRDDRVYIYIYIYIYIYLYLAGSLDDIYRLFKEPESAKQTSNIRQFLWRDLTSKFDIVGSYFTASSTMDCKFVLACILDTIKLFQFHGLKTSLLVCDGASFNFSAIKKAMDTLEHVQLRNTKMRTLELNHGW